MAKELVLLSAGDIFFECDGQLTPEYKLIHKTDPSVWLKKISPVLRGGLRSGKSRRTPSRSHFPPCRARPANRMC